MFNKSFPDGGLVVDPRGVRSRSSMVLLFRWVACITVAALAFDEQFEQLPAAVVALTAARLIAGRTVAP